MLIFCFLPQGVQYLESVWFPLSIVKALIQNHCKTTTPVVVGLIHLFYQLIEALVNLSEVFLPTRSQHKSCHLIESSRGIVNEKCIASFICTLGRLGLWVFSLASYLLLGSDEVQSFRNVSDCFFQRCHHLFSLLISRMGGIGYYFCFDQQGSNVELIRS